MIGTHLRYILLYIYIWRSLDNELDFSENDYNKKAMNPMTQIERQLCRLTTTSPLLPDIVAGCHLLIFSFFPDFKHALSGST